MKNLIKTFAIPKEGKVSDKTFTYNIVAGILGILLCLTSLTAATWAWFGSSLTAENNTIKSGQYFVEKTVTEQKTLSTAEVTAQNETTETMIDSDANGVYTLSPNAKYHVKLEGQGDVTTGYCKVTLTGSAKSVHTQQIFTTNYANENEGKVPVIEFDLLIGDVTNDVQLTIEPCWGTSSMREGEKLLNGGTYTYDGTTLTGNTFKDTEESDTTNTEENNTENEGTNTEDTES